MSSTRSGESKGAWAHLSDFFCSIKLSIFVLIALAATSIFGTVIQQEKDPSVYVKEYGAGVAHVIQILNLGDMYHSWWFQLLLALLLVNITFCSVRRLPHAIRLMRDREPVFDGRPVAIHERWEYRVKGVPRDAVAETVERLLSQQVAPPVRGEHQAKVYLYSSRGRWSRLGVYITHSSLFLFAVGALVGGQWGFKGFVEIPEGSSVKEVALRSGGVLPLGFEVRCDDFELTFYNDPQGRPTGRPKDYKSQLTVLENGREVLRKTIEVNSPLIYRGIYFYQSSYGQTGGSGAYLSVYGPNRNVIAYQAHVSKGGALELGEGFRLRLLDLTGDYRGMGPAVLVALEHNGDKPEEPVVIGSSAERPMPVGGYLASLGGVDTVWKTGLQVAKDPGVLVIWAGCILITIGLLVAFFTSHRRVWARVWEEGGSTSVLLAGNSSRNRIAFERRFQDLCDIVQETFEK